MKFFRFDFEFARVTSPVMLWQCMASFALWLAAGYWLARRTKPLHQRLRSARRSVVILAATSLLLLGASVLCGTLLWLGPGGIHEGQLTRAAWIESTVAGLIFVCTQALAFAMLVTLVQKSEPSTMRHSSGLTDPSGGDAR